MSAVFDLLQKPWLPVALASGRRVLVCPCDISQPFKGEPILRIATGRADCDISLAELLIGLITVAMSPADEDEWAERYKKPPSLSELEAALTPFASVTCSPEIPPRDS